MTNWPTTPDEVAEYLGNGLSADDVEDALMAEEAAQAARCETFKYAGNLDLREALMRRVARNLALRNLPLGVQADEGGGVRIGSSDPEVRRLEAPYRRLPVG